MTEEIEKTSRPQHSFVSSLICLEGVGDDFWSSMNFSRLSETEKFETQLRSRADG